jgi:uncharacterized membrane protein
MRELKGIYVGSVVTWCSTGAVLHKQTNPIWANYKYRISYLVRAQRARMELQLRTSNLSEQRVHIDTTSDKNETYDMRILSITMWTRIIL